MLKLAEVELAPEPALAAAPDSPKVDAIGPAKAVPAIGTAIIANNPYFLLTPLVTTLVGTEEDGTDEVGIDDGIDVGIDEEGMDVGTEVGNDEVGNEEVGTDEVGTEEVGMEDVCMEEVGIDEEGTDEVGTDEVGTAVGESVPTVYI